MNFKCKKCGGNELEEVMTGVTQSSVVNDIVDGDALYGNANTEGGEIACYQCSNCGKVIEGIENY